MTGDPSTAPGGTGQGPVRGPVTTGRLRGRQAAEHELAKPAYHRDDPGLLHRALDWLWDHLGALLDSAARATPGGGIGLLAITVVVVLLLVALRLRLGAPRRRPAASADGRLFGGTPRSAAQHRSAAEEHAAAARWSAAVQERMRAVVRDLEERALLEHRPGRTADEAAAAAGRLLPGHAAELVAAARDFDEVTYAGRSADAEAYRRLAALDDAVRRSRPALAGAGAPGGDPAARGRQAAAPPSGRSR